MNGDWRKVTKDNPCPICGKADWCKISKDCAVVLCGRIEEGSFQAAKDGGGYIHRLIEKRKPAKRDTASEYVGKAHRTYANAQEAVAAAVSSTGGILAGEWSYFRDDVEVARVCRANLPDGGKEFRPVHLNKAGWRLGDPKGLWPLYRLPELLAADPAGVVFVAEGEKTCDAVRSVGLVCVTSAHGSAAASKTDWTPLGQFPRVGILPDNDEPGQKYAGEVAGILMEQNTAADIRIVKLPGLPPAGDFVEYKESLDSKDDADIRQGVLALFEAAPMADESQRPGPTIICLADVEAKAIPWLWRGRIPCGRLSLFVGAPGLGKSYATCDFAARVTTGTPWPDGAECERGGVLFVTAEDDPADTIRPRLDAHHADLSRVHLLEGVRRRDDSGRMVEGAFTLADIPALEAALKMHPDTKLVIIDPIGSFIGGKTDAHRDNEIRAVLAPVARLAAQYGPAVLLVMHRKKAVGGTADSMALGSTGFVGIARVAWHLCRDKDNRERRLFLPGKNNLAKDCGGLAFTIEGDPIGAVHWERDPVLMSADDAVAEEAGQKRGPSADALEDAKTLLRDELKDGPKRCGYDKRDPSKAEPGTIWAAAMEAVSWSTLRRAKSALRIRAYREQFRGFYMWELPAEHMGAHMGAQTMPNRDNMGNLSNLSAHGDLLGEIP